LSQLVRLQPHCSGTLSDASRSCPNSHRPTSRWLNWLRVESPWRLVGGRWPANTSLRPPQTGGMGRWPPLSRAVAWLAEALRAEALGDSHRLMYACRRGLDVIGKYQSVLGSSELRAQITAHGAELAILGQRHALRRGWPWLLLAWSERWRAVALAVPPVRPPADEDLQAELATMRDISSRLSRASSLGRGAAPLQHELQRLEGVVRARAMRTLTAGSRTLPSPAVEDSRFPACLMNSATTGCWSS